MGLNIGERGSDSAMRFTRRGAYECREYVINLNLKEKIELNRDFTGYRYRWLASPIFHGFEKIAFINRTEMDLGDFE